MIKNNPAWRAFQTTVGVIIALVLGVFILGGIGYGVAWAHDSVLSSSFDKSPAYDSEIGWGAYSVSIDSKNTIRSAPIAAHSATCYTSNRSLGLYDSYAYLGSNTADPNCTYLVPATSGYSDTTAKLRIKNRLWLKTNQFKPDMIAAIFAGKMTSVGFKGIDSGQFFAPGKGGSADLEASYSIDAEGDFVLTHGSSKTIVH